MQSELWMLIPFAGVSLVTAFVALTLSSLLLPGSAAAARRRILPVFSDVTRHYTFREGYLLSKIDPNDAFLDPETDRCRAFDELRGTFASLEPSAPAKLDALQTRGEAFVTTFTFGPDLMTLSGYTEGDGLVLTIASAQAAVGREAIDSAVLRSMEGEVEELRNILDQSLFLVWKKGHDGRVEWANASYFEALATSAPERAEITWPIAELFEVDLALMEQQERPQRYDLTAPDGTVQGRYEVTTHRQADGHTVFMAIPIDRLVAAETALSDFMQTMSKSFALLPTGLAIFDRHRDLVLFNPALSRLSELEIEFLVKRPNLREFFDRLRNRQRMPEPKNYAHWRDHVDRMEEGAEAGSLQELWTLPGGQTLRVIGRPHPDGALAFMFEDITAEMSLTRQFRSELDLYRNVFGSLAVAIALFSHDGRVLYSNRAFQGLWHLENSPENLASLVAHCRNRRLDTAILADIEAYLAASSGRQVRCGEMQSSNGRVVSYRVSPLSGGATLLQVDPDHDIQDAQVMGESDVFPQSDRPPMLPFEVAEAPEDFLFQDLLRSVAAETDR